MTARCLGRRILVVDDNRDSTESMRLFLGMLGNEVAVAYDGLEAVESVGKFSAGRCAARHRPADPERV